MLEPLVNLCVLGGALAWTTSSGREHSSSRSVLAGSLLGFAAMIKLTGGAALLALLLAERSRASWKQRSVALGSSAAVAGSVLLPFLLLGGPLRVFEQVAMVQFRRPGEDLSGGTIPDLAGRIDHLGSYGPFALERLGGSAGLLGAVLATVAVIWAWRSGDSTGRFFAVMVAAGVVAILASPDYYDQYPVTVFSGIAVLIGGAAANVVEMVARYGPPMGVAAAFSLALCLVTGVGDSVTSVLASTAHRRMSSPVAGLTDIVKDDCVSSDLPEMLIALDRLPPRDVTGDRLVDPFGALMYEALRTDHFVSTAPALHSEAAQERLRQSLITCPFAVTRGMFTSPPARWSSSTRRWFLSHFDMTIRHQAGLTLWRVN
jgi:hypothetical protein